MKLLFNLDAIEGHRVKVLAETETGVATAREYLDKPQTTRIYTGSIDRDDRQTR